MEDPLKGLATELESCIKSGDYLRVKQSLDPITKPSTVDLIVAEFSTLDPVVLAVDCEQEVIALYLIEKSFTYSRTYTYSDQTCDQWCYKKHREDRCPSQYDALSLAQKRGLSRVVSLITDIEKGARKPGDGLASLQEPQSTGKKTDGKSHKMNTGLSREDGDLYETEADRAKNKFVELGPRYITKDGDTVIHQSVEQGPALVYICANAGVPINTQNFAGDTALHIAVRESRREVALALLICGADLSLRNKLGLTPLDDCPCDMRPLLEKFRPGLPQAASKGEHHAMQRLVRLWCHPRSVIRDGMSAIQLLQSRADCDLNAEKCLGLLKHNLKTLELAHAVLSEDLQQVQNITQSPDRSWNVNVRFGNRKGKTPVSCAIEQGNLALLQLLADTDRCHFNIRVSEQDLSDQTVPLGFKSLHRDSPTELWKCVHRHSDPGQIAEKDTNGNTCVLQAVENGKSAAFIDTVIKASAGTCIMHRNKEGQTLRDRAQQLQRKDIVEVIDQNMCELVGNGFLMHLPVHFYGQDNMDIYDQNGRSLQDLVMLSRKEDDMQATKNYAAAEKLGIKLFKAACRGDQKRVTQLNTANYQDQNGYTALIRAIVFNQLRAAELLITGRPGLKAIGDNCNRRPLHYAYALPEEQGKVFVQLLLDRNPEDIEHRVDKDGRQPVEYKELRNTPEIQEMLHDARTLDAYRQRKAPMGPLPADTEAIQEQTPEA